jgi:hypothetical protein
VDILFINYGLMIFFWVKVKSRGGYSSNSGGKISNPKKQAFDVVKHMP